MRKVALCLAMGVACIGVIAADDVTTFTCPPNYLISVPSDNGVTSAPDVSVDSAAQSNLVWQGIPTQPFDITISGTGCTYPNLKKDNSYTWESCPVQCTGTYPITINYTITFTTSHHQKNGRIIIVRPIQDKKKVTASPKRKG